MMRTATVTLLTLGCAVLVLAGCEGGDSTYHGAGGVDAEPFDAEAIPDVGDTPSRDAAVDGARNNDGVSRDASLDADTPTPDASDADAGEADAASGAPTVDPPAEFGEPCRRDADCEEGDAVCVSHDGEGELGFCSRSCADRGSRCLGLPEPDVRANCQLETEDGLSCIFKCILDHDNHLHQYPCPEALECEEPNVGPGKGDRWCVVPE